MDQTYLLTGYIKGILEKYAEPLIKGIVNLGKDEWEKFKIDFEIVFTEYLKNSMEKYGKIKTILYRTEPKYLYDFFECPNLQKEKGNVLKGDSIDNILDVSHFVIIQGSGGIGKSTFLKHLFMDEVSKKGWIPVFIELKDINSISEDYEITDFIFQRLSDLGSSLKKEYIEYALRSGCFTFLLDGYDEIATDKKNKFLRKFDGFCDRYYKNYFIISARPCSDFLEFQRFVVLTLCGLSKDQAKSLISKVELDQDTKTSFLTEFDNSLYRRYQSFASNPLLLNIMILTFNNYVELPCQLYQFYANTFYTLYYYRDRKSSLTYSIFKKILAKFCFVTYQQGESELSHDDIISILDKENVNTLQFTPECFLDDLTDSICILYRDGFKYKFIHRSFQEYFAAYYLMELPDQDMKKLGTELIKKDYFRATHDNVFSILREMETHKFEQNILLPLIVEFETECDNIEKYDFYFKKISAKIGYYHHNSVPTICDYYSNSNSIIKYGNIHLDPIIIRPYCNVNNKPIFALHRNFDGEFVGFLYMMARHHLSISEEMAKELQKAEDWLKSFLIEERKYRIGDRIETKDYVENVTVYELIKRTWIGYMFQTLANLREVLEQKS